MRHINIVNNNNNARKLQPAMSVRLLGFWQGVLDTT
jgi:hypothetical protein